MSISSNQHPVDFGRSGGGSKLVHVDALLLADPFDLRIGEPLDGLQQHGHVFHRPGRAVVPPDQLIDMGEADGWCRAVPNRLAAVAAQPVPGQVEGSLDRLGVHRRRPTAGMDDRSDEAGAHHRSSAQPVQSQHGQRLRPIWLTDGEPTVLQPAAHDQIVRRRDEGPDAVEVGQLRIQTIPALQ